MEPLREDVRLDTVFGLWNATRGTEHLKRNLPSQHMDSIFVERENSVCRVRILGQIFRCLFEGVVTTNPTV